MAGTITLELDPTWKLAIEWKLESMLAFAFPRIHRLINWSVTPISLDNELQKIAPEHVAGRLIADKLFKVMLLSGQECVLYLHIEIQGQRDGKFEFRMWTYNSRLCDRFGQDVISLAVLVDEDPNWRPEAYSYELGDFLRLLRFPVFKLWDCANPEDVFTQTDNPFALLAAATQAAWRTRQNMEARSRERLELVKHLYRRGMSREDVRTLFRFIERLTRLPEDLELKFREDLAVYEEKEKPMTLETLLSPYEEIMQEKGREEGRREGLQEGLLEVLKTRFGVIPDSVAQRVRHLTQETDVRRANRLGVTATSLADFLEHL